jgi:carbamoyl-phosphate synthase large subunit
MKPLNLLFTSAGRRDYLIEYFVDAMNGLGKVHVANSDPLCSSFTVGDAHVVTPEIHSVDYIPFLQDYCARENIRAIIPLFDIDLPVLAASQAEFAKRGVRVVVATSETVDICNDKWKTIVTLNEAGLSTPKTYLDLQAAVDAVEKNDIRFPLIVKPRWGMGSIGLMQVNTIEELPILYEMVRRRIFTSYLQFEGNAEPNRSVLIQETVEGVEYGLDVLNDLNGQYVVTVAKRKLAMRSGETDIAVTEDNPILSALGKTLSGLLRHPGNLDVDVFVDGEKVTVLELNCRFGGGYPFTHSAGAHFPAALVAWLDDREADPRCFQAQPNITAVKSIKPIVINRGERR